jgi:hypothetical protein
LNGEKRMMRLACRNGKPRLAAIEWLIEKQREKTVEHRQVDELSAAGMDSLQQGSENAGNGIGEAIPSDSGDPALQTSPSGSRVLLMRRETACTIRS